MNETAVPRLGLRLALTATVVVATTATGCAGEGSGSAESAGTITVSAAASLTEAFTDIGAAFEAANPEMSVDFNFDSSGTLSRQIIEGAPADVFASADEEHITTLADAGLVDGEPEVFARNELTIVVKPGNPTGVRTLADLAGAGIVSLCVDTAPCGRYTTEILDRAGVALPEDRVTRGQNVRATLTAVSDGDADAGIVYVTDAWSAGGAVEAVDVPDSQNATVRYPVAVLTEAGNNAVADAFVAFVLGDEARIILEDYAFLAP